jgi:hypothetical protein
MPAGRPATVGQLLETVTLRSARLIGGADGLDRTVADVVLHAVVSRSEPPGAGVLVVLDGSTLDDHAYLIDHALRVLTDCRGAGLIIASPRRPPDLGPARLANQFRMPFIVIDGIEALDLAFALRTTFWAADVDRASVLNRLLSDLALMQRRDAESLVELTTSITGVPVSLIDRNHYLVAGAVLVTENRRLATTVGHLIDRSDIGALHSVPIKLSPEEPISYWLLAESRGPDSGEAVLRTVLQLCGWYLTSILASARMRHEREARRRIAVLNELLEAGDRPELDLRNQLGDMGWTVTGWNLGLHIKVGGLRDQGRIVDLHAEICERLDAQRLRGPVIERTDGWTGWLTFQEEPSVSTYAEVTAGVSTALAGFVAAHPGVTAHAGIGRPYSDVVGLRRSLGEAQEASLIAVARIRGTSGAAHIDQLGVQRVLMGWFGSEEFKRFADSMLEPLVSADRDGALLKTLEAYLDAAGSGSGAASSLGVHRNTVSNRVQRVESLLGVDLADPEVRLSLQLACRMVRLSS